MKTVSNKPAPRRPSAMCGDIFGRHNFRRKEGVLLMISSRQRPGMLLNIPQGTGCPNKEGCDSSVNSAKGEKLCSTVKTVMLEKALHCAFFVTNKSCGSTHTLLCRIGGKVLLCSHVGFWLHKDKSTSLLPMEWGLVLIVFQEALGTPTKKKPLKKGSWHWRQKYLAWGEVNNPVSGCEKRLAIFYS